MQITHIPVHPNFLLTWLSSSPIFTWYSTHQQYLLSMSSPNLFMPIYTCYVCIDEALLDYADFWYRVGWKPWIYKCQHAFTKAPFPLKFKRRGWWQPIAQTTPPMILLVIASARKCSLCWSKCWSAHTQLHALKTLVGAIYKWVGSNWGNQGISMSQLPPWCQGSPPVQVGNSCLGV